MEDINDNLPTEGKKYYNSRTEYVFTDEYMKSVDEGFYLKFKNELFKLDQLVCASNMENARKAVKDELEKSKQYLVLKCRIDYLIVGD